MRRTRHHHRLERYLEASLDTTCPECRGTLNIQLNQHTTYGRRPVLRQDATCLHCSASFARLLPIPQPNPTWAALTHLAQLAFTSARVQVFRVANAVRQAIR